MNSGNTIKKNVADFSLRPGPRYIEQGKDSGELFYNQYLKKWFDEALTTNSILEIVLDGTDGYLSSFIDEAFGRLVFYYSKRRVENVLRVISVREPHWLIKLSEKTYPAWEERRIQGKAPKNTSVS